jgi:hypothetical protein
LTNKDLIVNQELVVDADFIQEVISSYFKGQMRQNIRNVLHQYLLSLQVIETQQRQVIVNTKQYSAVVLGQFSPSSNYLDVLNQRHVNLFCQIYPLEQVVVLLLLV